MASGAPAGPTVELVVSEAFVKCAEVILASRIYGARATSEQQSRGRAWFNLEVEEVEGASKALERWRRETGLPLVLEVFLQPWGAQAAGSGQQDKVETPLERWVVHYYPMLPEGPSHLSRSQLSRLNPASVYKRLVITLRSLYTYVRVLPAYRMYRACKRQRGSNFTIGYRVHSTLPGRSAVAAPGSRRMQSFKFGAVDTPYGQFRIAVDYQPASTVTILEQTTSPPPLPQIIADYVGSPAAAHGRGGAPPLRHAMSASAVGLSPPQPGAGRQQQPQLPSSPLPQQPGGSPLGALGRTASGMPIRRSWSTSMRGVSPQRTLSQPSSELPSPVATGDTPYGSAPQALSLPAMLRALSTSSGKYVVGSPSGRPPLAKPPRTVSGAMPAGTRPAADGVPFPAGGSGSPAGGLGGAATAAAGAGLTADNDLDSDSGSPCGSAGSSARQSSAPMSIPGRGGGLGCAPGQVAGRRLRSSNDLWAIQQAANMHKPLSAPAVSHMPQPAAGAAAPGAATAAAAAAAGETAAAAADSSGGGDGRRSRRSRRAEAEGAPSPPPARMPFIPGTLDSESSGSAASSLYPTSCSPQLPFAFTPSAQSLASFGARGPLQDSMRLERISPRPGLGRTHSNTSTSGGGSAPQGAAAAAALMQQGAAQRALASGGGAATTAMGYSPSSGGSSGGGSGGPCSGGGGSGRGGVTGREVPASTALMRRPSWSSRSSTYNQLSGEASQQGVGYSVSPMQDPTLESILAGSTPRQYSLAAAGGLPSPLSAAPPGSQLATGGGASRAGSAASGYGAPLPMLTFPSASGELSGGLDEADVLPFDLDEGGSSPLRLHSRPEAAPPSSALASPLEQLPVSTGANGSSNSDLCAHAAPCRATAGGGVPPVAPPCVPGPGAAASAPAAAVAPAIDTDAAVGAFVRLIQEAPPLHMHGVRAHTHAASADMAASLQAAAAPGTSSGSDSSAATCLSDGRGLTLQAGLRQFSRIKERLQQRGVVVGGYAAEV